MNIIFNLYQTMQSQKLILMYSGDVTQEITRSLLAMAERKLEVAGEDPAIRRKVFKVMVESLQNIVRHAEQTDGDREADALFALGRERDRYSVMSGNTIPKSRVEGLKKTLDAINALDRKGLRELYKQSIQNTPLSAKGGAGVGLVDMARKSNGKLSFQFPEVSSTRAFFCLEVTVSRVPND